MNTFHRGLAVGTAGIITVALAVPATADSGTTTELDGDGSGNVTITEPGYYVDTDSESFRTVTIASDGVTLDGLTFDGQGTTTAGVRNGQPGLSDIAVLDSSFTGYTGRSITIGFAEGADQREDRGANLEISGNTLDDMAGNAATSIAVFNTDGVTVTDNQISNADPAFSGRRGINLDSNSAIEVRGNTVSLGAGGTVGQTFNAAPWAIQVATSDAPALDHEVLGNTLSGSYDGIVVLSRRDVTGLRVVGNDIAAVMGVRVNAGGAPPVGSSLTFASLEVSGNRVDATAFDTAGFASNAVRLQDTHNASTTITYRDVRVTGNSSVGTSEAVVVGPNAVLENVRIRGNS